ncbi:MAG: SGNH/GDSL hydrolase family protein [Planctomycetota bacterium]
MHKRIDFQPEQTLLFIGDSITDCQRRELPYVPLGCGYVNFAANFLLAAHPNLNLDIENRGISGDTTEDLSNRWDADCIELKPDIVSLMIGINDSWRKYGETPDIRSMHIGNAEYEQNLSTLLKRIKDECGSQLILMEPFMFCDDPSNPMLQDLNAYIEIVHQMADEFDATLVPVHTNYMKLKDKRPADQWADDTVHPSQWAHAWIAQQWLNAIL